MEQVIDFVPFIQEHDDFTASLGITALMEDGGAYLIADYPMSGDFAGYKFVIGVTSDYGLIARAWFDLTGLSAPDSIGEAA